MRRVTRLLILALAVGAVGLAIYHHTEARYGTLLRARIVSRIGSLADQPLSESGIGSPASEAEPSEGELQRHMPRGYRASVADRVAPDTFAAVGFAGVPASHYVIMLYDRSRGSAEAVQGLPQREPLQAAYVWPDPAHARGAVAVSYGAAEDRLVTEIGLVEAPNWRYQPVVKVMGEVTWVEWGGERLAAIARRPGHRAIVLVDVAARTARDVYTEEADARNPVGALAVSPDGRYIAFSRLPHAEPNGWLSPARNGIWLIDGGSGAVQEVVWDGTSRRDYQYDVVFWDSPRSFVIGRDDPSEQYYRVFLRTLP